jgi:hypothetical protein
MSCALWCSCSLCGCSKHVNRLGCRVGVSGSAHNHCDTCGGGCGVADGGRSVTFGAALAAALIGCYLAVLGLDWLIGAVKGAARGRY